ncbi:PadR family transcriptional regulator [Aliicoccus persicus]|uniref:PadR family transcriptional regulator n=1 Tax=Aliicoccus persicus TaxID=930138 RepID=A0A662Z5A4_9STAP|nr:PadR family transcriptional regulator [Aliicoccus persicus]SEV99326.1 PadR family transcriptional regulator, regulatory protein PadR [Aliicoccus persicus]HJE20046.1 PadR family transcriptional regulator [Aliicoccus persicus]
MNVQLKKGSLTMIVLSFIGKEKQYGYQLAQNVSNYIEIAEGTLYPLLRRLVKEKHLKTTLEESTEGPARKYYELTEDGIAYLDELVEEWKVYTKAVETILNETERK